MSQSPKFHRLHSGPDCTACPLLLIFISQFQLWNLYFPIPDEEGKKINVKSSCEQVTHPREGFASRAPPAGLGWWHNLSCAGLWSTGWTKPLDFPRPAAPCQKLIPFPGNPWSKQEPGHCIPLFLSNISSQVSPAVIPLSSPPSLLGKACLGLKGLTFSQGFAVGMRFIIVFFFFQESHKLVSYLLLLAEAAAHQELHQGGG